jgi:hypothetical protein
MSIDGTCIDVADTPANAAQFGRPGTGRGEGTGAFPQVRLVGLAECGTHALTATAMGACSSGEITLARDLLGSLDSPGCWCWPTGTSTASTCGMEAVAISAQLLWRTKAVHVLPVGERLADGSYLSRLGELVNILLEHPRLGRFVNFHMRQTDVAVRVIDHGLDDPGRPQAEPRCRLITTILDPGRRLAAL